MQDLPTIMFRVAPARFGWLAAGLLTSSCSSAPSQDILGSFFPAWLLCAAIGVVVAVICRRLLVAAGLGEAVLYPPLTYVALAAAVTLAVWLVWFGG